MAVYKSYNKKKEKDKYLLHIRHHSFFLLPGDNWQKPWNYKESEAMKFDSPRNLNETNQNYKIL